MTNFVLKVMIVAGVSDENGTFPDTTEIQTVGSGGWSFTSPLPRPIYVSKMVYFHSFVLSTSQWKTND